MTSGTILKALREKAGYSQEQVAMLLGVSPVSIQNWESGKPMRYPKLLKDLLDMYDADDDDRIRVVILMYGSDRDREYLRNNKEIGGAI